jgi:hypothetical protein
VLCAVLLTGANVYSTDKTFTVLDASKVSRYSEDRVCYQRIDKNVSPYIENSRESLLVIRKSKIYFIVDGYDVSSEVDRKRAVNIIENRYVPNEDLWTNKINGKPDFIRILDRRQIKLENSNEEFVTTNFGAFFKTAREKLLKRHIEVFHQLMQNRTESELVIDSHPIQVHLNAKESENVRKTYMSAHAKTITGVVYSCEDADGDGVTETFSVTFRDGFNWGIDSGANIIFIYNNTDKDIETLIGKLAFEAVRGSVGEEKSMIETFPDDQDIFNVIDDITPLERNQ